MFNSKTTGAVLAMAGGMLVSTLAAQAQTTRYVDDDCTPPGAGTEVDPFCLIQDCIDAAADGDTVEVADGTYTGTGNRDLDFGGRLITVRSANGSENCTIDAQGSGLDPHRGFIFQSAETAEAVVEGFTITGGNHGNGGGMYCTSSSPTVTNCTFDGNSATNGGGMYCRNGSSPTISNCTFTENSVTGTASQDTGTGGAIHSFSSSPTVERCTFTRNTATAGANTWTGNGGAIYARFSSPLIEDCKFIDNKAYAANFCCSGSGGGLFIDEGSDVILRNCTLVGNAVIVGTASVSTDGGGIMTYHGDAELTNCIIIGNKAIGGSPPIEQTGNGGGFMGVGWTSKLTNCIFAGNSATGGGCVNGGGGGLLLADQQPLLTNCAIIGNSAECDGGGMWIGAGNPPLNIELVNCTVSGNSSDGSGGGIYSTTEFGGPVTTSVNNSIVWDNTPDSIVADFGAVTTVGYSDIEGGWLGGTANITADPLFIDGPSGVWTSDGVYAPDDGQTTLTDADATWDEDTLVGLFINPDTSQNLQSLIVANTATTITVWADFTDQGTFGANYQIREYHLTDSSPCIDAADNTAVPPELEGDLDGNPRFVNDLDTQDTGVSEGGCPVVDMGAHEYQDGTMECCPADFDGDGAVGAFDLALLLGSWGPYEPCPPFGAADFNEDCAVNAADLAQLLGNWGPCD